MPMYADPQRNYAETPMRRSRGQGCNGVSMYRCAAVLGTLSAGPLHYLRRYTLEFKDHTPLEKPKPYNRNPIRYRLWL